MNYLFLLNAGVLFFLGAYIYASKKNGLSLQFFIFASGLSGWNICGFLLNNFPLDVNVALVVKTQLLLLMVFVNGIYYFCSSYPFSQRQHNYVLNIGCALFLSSALIFTPLITQATLLNEEIIYQRGSGYILLAGYITILSAVTAVRLISAYRINPKYRDRIKFIFIGLATFAIIVLICVVILPILKVNTLVLFGQLSSIFPAFLIAYAMTKYDFMDIGVIINRKTAWLLTISIIILSYIFFYHFAPNNDVIKIIVLAMLGIFWTIYGAHFQKLMLTSARRKFIRSWYDTEDLISEISNQITVEKNREAIFKIIEKIIDDAFQLEKSELIFAIRDEDQLLTHYVSIKKSSKGIETIDQVKGVLIDSYNYEKPPLFLEDCEQSVVDYLVANGFKKGKGCIVVPFYSPDILEGIIVLGERSCQEIYTNRDMQFFLRLVKYMSAILYRLTPFEKLESQYIENKQRLHEAEIQLLRAQKIEAIVHATRQCHHEIRTPLNIINLGIGRIKNLHELQSYQAMAKEEIQRALEIVEETLIITDVSKASEDRVSIFNLNEVVQRCARVVDSSKFNLTLNQDTVPEIKGVMSDIQVAITNLLHNAMEAMPAGGKLTLKLYCLSGRVIVEVEDDGPGIADNLRLRVWEPYFSGKGSSVGNSSAGRGWGLTIVNRIITEHQGTINFTSELNKGTKFIISLPFDNNL